MITIKKFCFYFVLSNNYIISDVRIKNYVFVVIYLYIIQDILLLFEKIIYKIYKEGKNKWKINI